MIEPRSMRKGRWGYFAWLATVPVLLPATGAYAQASWPCSFSVPTVSSTVPNDTPLTNQATLNCFAWQEFIALNWPAMPGQRGVADPNATPAMFGAPGANAPTVWETYKDKSEVFLASGAKPKSWNDPPPAPPCAKANAAVLSASRKPGVQVLSLLSAFGDFRLDETNQASGQWLADQNGNLVYYDIRINKDEFDAIVRSGFYNADVQKQTAATGVNPTPGGDYQVKLPAGCNAGGCPNNGTPQLGAIELKSAWRKLTDPAQYSRYLTSQAVLTSPSGGCTQATMGLVGLHIIHKTVSQPQFIWATFEQVDNVPPASPATMNSPSCACASRIPDSCLPKSVSPPVYQNCQAGQQACASNKKPPYNMTTASCPAYPVQVTRHRPISNTTTDPVTKTNAAAKDLIVSQNPQTVFQYYQLVDVLWSNSPQDPYAGFQPGKPGPPVPLKVNQQVPEPNALPVANTTMETYVQDMTCLSCHVFANVPKSGNKKDPTYASDYSFILGDAESPGGRNIAAASRNVAAASEGRRHFPEGLIKLNR